MTTRRLSILLAVAVSASPSCDRGNDEAASTAKEPVAAEKAPSAPVEKANAPAAAEKPVEPVAKASAPEPAVDAPKPAPAPKELIAYVPEGAKLVLVADPKAVGRTSLFADSGAFVEKLGKSRIGEVYAAAKACNVGVDAWRSVLVAGDGGSEDNMIIGARATGIGKKDTLQCLADGINAIATSGKWTVSEDAGRVVFDVEGRDTRGIAAADDILLVVGKGYRADVTSILDGAGKSAADAELGRMLARVDRSKHVYFAGEAPAGATDGPFTDLKQLSGTLDFSAGLALAVALEFGDPTKAEMSAQMLGQMVAMTSESVAGLGVPESILRSVKIETKGNTVSTRASASKTELEAVVTAFEKQL